MGRGAGHQSRARCVVGPRRSFQWPGAQFGFVSLRCQSARRVWPGRHQRNRAVVVRGLVAHAAGRLSWSCAGASSVLRPRLLPMQRHLVLCFAHAPRRLFTQFRIGFVLAPSASPRAQLCVQADRRGSLSFKPTAAVRRRLNAALDIGVSTLVGVGCAVACGVRLPFAVRAQGGVGQARSRDSRGPVNSIVGPNAASGSACSVCGREHFALHHATSSSARCGSMLRPCGSTLLSAASHPIPARTVRYRAGLTMRSSRPPWESFVQTNRCRAAAA